MTESIIKILFVNLFMIRAANLEDIPKLMKLDKNWDEENITWNFSKLTKKDFQENITDNITLVAEENNEIVGYLLATREKATSSKHTIKKNQKYLDIDSIYVAKNYRDKNIGSKLLKYFFKIAKNENYKIIKVAASSVDIISVIRFYEKHGFKPLFAILVKKM